MRKLLTICCAAAALLLVGGCQTTPSSTTAESSNNLKANLETLKKNNACRNCYLPGANLQGADLQKANLRGANLQGANLWGAKLDSDDLAMAKAQGAVGLATEAEQKAEEVTCLHERHHFLS